MEKLITKSFKRLLDKGIHRGFITYEELGKSLGKRHFSQNNIESAFLHIFDNKISLVEKKSYPSSSACGIKFFKFPRTLRCDAPPLVLTQPFPTFIHNLPTTYVWSKQ